jgi:NhaP-type Na+/H+ or K+/H+ antiporter
VLDALNIHYDPNILAVIGLIIAVAFLGSKLFQRVGIPQVVGFIVVGVLLGPSLLNTVPPELSDELTFISEVALGPIGFNIGSHLLFSELRKLGRSIVFILVFEALSAFALVTAGVYAITQSWHIALVFGAFAAATDPATTMDVLAEYDAKGPLTTSLLAVVGMDDAVVLVIFSIAAATAECLFAQEGSPSLLQIAGLPLIEIGGSALLGIAMGLLLDFIMRRMKRRHDAMAISIGFVFICVGLGLAQRMK